MGLLSDHFEQAHGAVGLRYGLLAMVGSTTLGILHFVLGSRSLRSDVDLRAERLEGQSGVRF